MPKYRETPPTLSDGQVVDLLVDNEGKLVVTGFLDDPAARDIALEALNTAQDADEKATEAQDVQARRDFGKWQLIDYLHDDDLAAIRAGDVVSQNEARVTAAIQQMHDAFMVWWSAKSPRSCLPRSNAEALGRPVEAQVVSRLPNMPDTRRWLPCGLSVALRACLDAGTGSTLDRTRIEKLVEIFDWVPHQSTNPVSPVAGPGYPPVSLQIFVSVNIHAFEHEAPCICIWAAPDTEPTIKRIFGTMYLCIFIDRNIRMSADAISHLCPHTLSPFILSTRSWSCLTHTFAPDLHRDHLMHYTMHPPCICTYDTTVVYPCCKSCC